MILGARLGARLVHGLCTLILVWCGSKGWFWVQVGLNGGESRVNLDVAEQSVEGVAVDKSYVAVLMFDLRMFWQDCRWIAWGKYWRKALFIWVSCELCKNIVFLEKKGCGFGWVGLKAPLPDAARDGETRECAT